MFCVLLRVCENVTTVYEIFKYGIERIAGVGGFYDLHCFLVIVLTTGLKLDGLSVVYRFVEHMRNIEYCFLFEVYHDEDSIVGSFLLCGPGFQLSHRNR